MSVRLRTATGELDGEFDVVDESDRGGDFSIVLHARGDTRNSDYVRVLDVLLRAVGIAGAEIVCMEVASQPARSLSPADRTLPLRYPVRPDPGGDVLSLRSEITRLQVPIAQRPGARRGNSTKRLRIHVRAHGVGAGSFESGLVGPEGWLRRRAFLVTWNPDVWNDWPERQSEIAATERGRAVRGRWSTGTRRRGIRQDDVVLLFRQGRRDRGIVGWGVATGPGECVFRELHFDPERAARGEEASYIDVSWRCLLSDIDRLAVEDLRTDFPGVSWDNIQASGQQIPAVVANGILGELRGHVAEGAGVPEVDDARRAVAISAGRTGARQGFRLTTAQRDAVEQHAMTIARRHLQTLGWTQIDDTSKGNPFDYLCSKSNGATLHVEVKGTTSAGDVVVLTRREVHLHQQRHPHNALIIVHGIRLEGLRREEPTGGTVRFISPWNINPADLQVIGYTYTPGSS